MVFYPEGLRHRVWNVGVSPVLRIFADDDLTLLRRLRILIRLVIVVAFAVLLAAPFFGPGKYVDIAGILFAIAGAARLFLAEEIEKRLAPFNDKNAYPNGPPSVAMQELIMPEAGPYSAEAPGLSRYYYSKRGIILLLFGFTLQLVSAIIG
jgi:hypothetical protein